jgi:hypothetical protein
MADGALGNEKFFGGRGKGGMARGDLKRAQGGSGWKVTHAFRSVDE